MIVEQHLVQEMTLEDFADIDPKAELVTCPNHGHPCGLGCAKGACILGDIRNCVTGPLPALANTSPSPDSP